MSAKALDQSALLRVNLSAPIFLFKGVYPTAEVFKMSDTTISDRTFSLARPSLSRYGAQTNASPLCFIVAGAPASLAKAHLLSEPLTDSKDKCLKTHTY